MWTGAEAPSLTAYEAAGWQEVTSACGTSAALAVQVVAAFRRQGGHLRLVADPAGLVVLGRQESSATSGRAGLLILPRA